MALQLISHSLQHNLYLTLFTRNYILHTSFRSIHQGAFPCLPPPISALDNPNDTAKARSWLSRFKSQSIPKSLVDLTFSRSSGPGGQNVNKVNTKATLRCPLDSPWIPIWARPRLQDSSHYVASTKSILITSTVFRSQAQNIDDCLQKLHALVHSAAAAGIKNEPTEQQKNRVVALEKAEKASRRREKAHRSGVKKGRASGRKATGTWD